MDRLRMDPSHLGQKGPSTVAAAITSLEGSGDSKVFRPTMQRTGPGVITFQTMPPVSTLSGFSQRLVSLYTPVGMALSASRHLAIARQQKRAVPQAINAHIGTQRGIAMPSGLMRRFHH
jgi:hypothetical protein